MTPLTRILFLILPSFPRFPSGKLNPFWSPTFLLIEARECQDSRLLRFSLYLGLFFIEDIYLSLLMKGFLRSDKGYPFRVFLVLTPRIFFFLESLPKEVPLARKKGPPLLFKGFTGG